MNTFKCKNNFINNYNKQNIYNINTYIILKSTNIIEPYFIT